MERSETIVELAKALNSFQGKLKAVKKDAVNPFFHSHYATLDAIWEAIREPLTSSGLAVTQTIGQTSEGKPLLDTTLLHTSGEWIQGTMLVNPVKDDPQGLGSAISYARRYSLSAMLGVVADEDDDANLATKLKEKPQPKSRLVQEAKKLGAIEVKPPETMPEPLPQPTELESRPAKTEGSDNVLVDTSWEAVRPELTKLYQKKEGWMTTSQIINKLKDLGADMSSGKIQPSYETLNEASKLKFVWMIKEASKKGEE